MLHCILSCFGRNFFGHPHSYIVVLHLQPNVLGTFNYISLYKTISRSVLWYYRQIYWSLKIETCWMRLSFHIHLFTLAYNLSTILDEESDAITKGRGLVQQNIKSQKEKRCFFSKELALRNLWRDLYKEKEFQNGWN